jgi:hypothetical protein
MLRAKLSAKLIGAVRAALAFLALVTTCEAVAADFSVESAGGRFSFSERDPGHGFRAAEAFVNCNLPGQWELGNQFLVKSRIDFTAGWLGRDGQGAVTGSAGPAFAFRYNGLPLWLETGSSPTLISRHDFGDLHLGGAYQFTTHVGLAWDITPRWRVEYRFEHISNAGIYKQNPGVNLHAFAFGYQF